MDKKIFRFIGDNLDTILASAGAVFGLILTVYLQTKMGRVVFTITGVLSFLACIAYLILKHRQKLANITFARDIETKPSILLLVDTLFFALFAFSLWALALRSETYVRPLEYFIAIAVMSAILAIKILFLPYMKSPVALTLFQIIAVGLSLEWSVLLLYPSIVGQDPWFHQSETLKLLDQGNVGQIYGGLPAMHLIIGATSLVAGLDYKLGTMLSVCLLQMICDVLFVFLIGRLLFNHKIGLLAALLMAVANWHIFFGYWTIPNALGATFVLIIIYLLLKLHKEKLTLVIPVCGLLMAALLLTHPIAMLWLSLLLFTSWLSFIIYKNLFRQKLATLTPLALALAFTVVMLMWWGLGTGYLQHLGLLIARNFEPELGLTYALGRAPIIITPPVQEMISGAPPLEFLFNSLGMFLFFSLSFIGCLYMFSRKFSNPYAFFIAIAGILILSIGYFPMLRGMSVIEHRWWHMAEILLSVPLAVALCLLTTILRKQASKAALVAILVFILTFLMVMGLPSNMDNRTFSPNQLVRYAFTASELQALDTASACCDGTIGVDGYYTAAANMPELYVRLKGKLEGISPCLLSKDFAACHPDMLLIREEIVFHPIGTGGGTVFRLNYDPRQLLSEQGFSKVYDCGSVSGFSR